MNFVIGVYDGVWPYPIGDLEKQKRYVESTIKGFENIGFVSKGIYKITEFPGAGVNDYVIVCAPHNEKNHELFIYNYKTIWLDISSFYNMITNILDSDLIHLHLYDRHNIFFLKYLKDLPDDRMIKFGLYVKDREYKNDGKFIISHNKGIFRLGDDLRIHFFDDVVKYCFYKNINFKLCFHPTTDQKELDFYINRYNRFGKFEYSIGSKNDFDSCKALIFYAGKLMFESVYNDIPFFTPCKYIESININNGSFVDFINNPKKINREDRISYLNWVSYQNWTENELICGIAQDFLISFWN